MPWTPSWSGRGENADMPAGPRGGGLHRHRDAQHSGDGDVGRRQVHRHRSSERVGAQVLEHLRTVEPLLRTGATLQNLELLRRNPSGSRWASYQSGGAVNRSRRPAAKPATDNRSSSPPPTWAARRRLTPAIRRRRCTRVPPLNSVRSRIIHVS